jgi:Fe-S cluster assembly iron-binding protein IscA
MNLSHKAEARLKQLLPQGTAGFSVTGYLGTCRGSTPIMKPADNPADGQETLTAGGITFFVNAEIANEFSDSTLDYDPSLFGKGLTASWPHRAGCACKH